MDSQERKKRKMCYSVYEKGLRDGVIVRPDKCSRCDTAKGVIQGHHKDHSKPLDVEWLCSTCHGEVKSEAEGKLSKVSVDEMSALKNKSGLWRASEISKILNLSPHTVRYRLSELRRKGKIKFQQFGQTYAYQASAARKVKDFGK